MSLHSRFASEKFVYTSPKRDVDRFIEEVNNNCRKFATDFIFPTSEAAIVACSLHRKELISVPLIPSDRDIQLSFSKANTLKIAESLGIAVPKTVHIVDDTQLSEKLSLNFPVAVKSESSEVLSSSKASSSPKTAYFSSRGELEAECRSRLANGQAVLVQEFIDGYGVGISGLFKEGQPVAVVGHRRIRESNPLGGPSALAETIELDPGLLQATSALMRAIGFSGPAMAEFKIDRHTGRAYLMEINGRFWGTVLLAPAAGLDLPYLYWKMLNGLEIEPEEKRYKMGVRGRYLVGDTKCLLLSLKGKPEHWPGEFPKRWPAISGYLKSFFDAQTKDLILTRDDPRPFVARLIQDFV